MSYWLIFALVALTSASAHAQIWNLSTNGTGDQIFFISSLSPRGSGDAAVEKALTLRNGSVSVVEASPEPIESISYPFSRTAVSSSGEVYAVNRSRLCQGGSRCIDLASTNTTEIHTPSGTLSFDGTASISPNGRYAAIFNNLDEQQPIPVSYVRLVDLENMLVTLVGPQFTDEGQLVANDGSVLVRQGEAIRVVRPRGSLSFPTRRPVRRALLAADASRVVYDVPEAPFEIRVLDLDTGTDRSLGPGREPMLAEDGRQFSYLSIDSEGRQISMGDAVTGVTRPLIRRDAGFRDQTITGDGTTVVAAANDGRLLAIDSTTGQARELFRFLTRAFSLLSNVVPGSYNELLGPFPQGIDPEIRAGDVSPMVLGRVDRGTAFQFAWNTNVNADAAVTVSFADSPLEQRVGTGVLEAAGVALALGRSGDSLLYAIHENWSGFVSPQSPARPGEVVHMYGVGYGPVDGSVPNGQRTPSVRPFRITAGCEWRAIGIGSDPRPIAVPYAGLAPGMVGMYQLDVRIPSDWRYALFNAYCDGTGIVLRTAAIPVSNN